MPCRGVKRVPAHMRDTQAAALRVDGLDIAVDPAEPRRDLVFKPPRRQQLHADADPEKRPRFVAHGLGHRGDHAGHGVEAGAAVGESADTRQNDAVRAENLVRIARDRDGAESPASRAARSKALRAECRLPEP